MAPAACYVATLRVGGGARLKILDARVMSKAVVRTSVGCEELDARDGENILIRDDAPAFADVVHRVLREPVLRQRLENATRRTAERTYECDVIGRTMIPRLRGAARVRRPPQSLSRPENM